MAATTRRSIDQQIAEKMAELARLQNKARQLETGQKIILGGMLLAAARHDSKIRAWVIREADRAVTRDIDKKRIRPLLDQLKTMRDARKPEGEAGEADRGPDSGN